MSQKLWCIVLTPSHGSRRLWLDTDGEVCLFESKEDAIGAANSQKLEFMPCQLDPRPTEES